MKINQLEDYVFEILRNDELSRRDDCYLILKVIEKLYPYEIGKKFAEAFEVLRIEMDFSEGTKLIGR